MAEPIFREKSLKRVTSPEDLGDYLHVTSPTVWMLLAAIILLLLGVLAWSATANIDSIATGTAQVEAGSMIVILDDERLAGSLEPGMLVRVGEKECKINSVGTEASGTHFASAETGLADGVYDAVVVLRQTQVLRLLFN